MAAAAVLMAGCATAATTARAAGPPVAAKPAAATAPASGRATASAGAAAGAAAGLRTCGKVTGSTGVHRGQLTVRLSGPSVMATGQTFHGTVTVSLTSGSSRRAVTLMSGAPALPVITRGTAVVGQYQGGVGGVGLAGTVAVGHPFTLPFGSGTVLLRGCPTTVDPAHPDRTRKLLPPGRYTLYVSIEDDSPGHGGNLLSQPHPITLTARPTSATR